MIEIESIKVCERDGGVLATITVTNAHYHVTYDPQNLPMFIQMVNKADKSVSLVPITNIKSARVLHSSIPEHQPLGTPERNDTPSGKKKRYSMKTFKENQASSSE